MVAKTTTANSMNADEIAIVDEVKDIYKELMKVPCTGCNYCMPCPFGVDIPSTFSDYNNKYFFGGMTTRIMYMGRVVGMQDAGKSGADLCTDCGLCEKHCPQEIEIRKELKIAHKELNNRLITGGMKIALRFMGKKTSKKDNKK